MKDELVILFRGRAPLSRLNFFVFSRVGLSRPFPSATDKSKCEKLSPILIVRPPPPYVPIRFFPVQRENGALTLCCLLLYLVESIYEEVVRHSLQTKCSK